MSQHRPARRQPAYIYRRRRLAVLGLVVFVVAITWFAWPKAITPHSARPTATSSALASDGSTTAPTAGIQTTAHPGPTAATGPAPDCQGGDLAISALTDADTYPAGAEPQLTIQVINNGSSACTLNAGSSQQALVLSTGGEIVWQSGDCQSSSQDYPVVLQPNQPVRTEPITWDRTRSAPQTCTQTRPAAPAGGARYRLDVSIGSLRGTASAQFTLR